MQFNIELNIVFYKEFFSLAKCVFLCYIYSAVYVDCG